MRGADRLKTLKNNYINNEITQFQKKLYGYYCFFYRRLFGLRYPGDGESNHNQLITIGRNAVIARTVQFITSNHNLQNPTLHDKAYPINIGSNCWLGANVIILPNITLGNHTIVGAGSVVTKSFPNGYCVIAGNPAKKIKNIIINKMVINKKTIREMTLLDYVINNKR